MAGKIKENSARNNYGCYATGAIRAERNGEYSGLLNYGVRR